ncbi:MAG: UvrD-helicase domain-containing protein [Verrucomicrobiota bacterium]
MSREYTLNQYRPVTNLRIDYAKELNPQQYEAVTATPGPALVIAGAGSGKTRTLTYRVAFLLEQGIPADRILLLTFTNKAAKEMMRRVMELLDGANTAVWGGTFHSVGARVLRRHAEAAGYRPDFTIIDRDDADDLIKTCTAEAGVDVKKSQFPKPNVLGEMISMALNTCRSLAELLKEEYTIDDAQLPQILDVAKRYQARKRATNVMDFDDLLVLWLKLLKENAEARELYQRKFQFILVDEYQDTNKLQSDLIDLLAEHHKNVMVVGDDSQSIYAWRGANYKNILGFPNRYANARVFKIEVNYRSTPEILNVANAAIKANLNQFTKQLQPARKSGEKPALVACEDGHQQASFIAQRILELQEAGVGLKDIAVLYRSHFHSLEVQMELTRRNIPYSLTSGIRFFEQAHIKDVTAYLKLLCNPLDELSLKRIAAMMPGVGAKAAAKLWSACQTAFTEATAQMPAPAAPPAEGESAPLPPHPPLAPVLGQLARVVPAKAAKDWQQFTDTMAQLEEPELRDQPGKLIELVVEAGYDVYVKENFQNFKNRLEDLDQLAMFARQFPTTSEFLTQLSLLTNVEAEHDRQSAKDDDQVKLTTIHQAKGLEFDVVFLIMLNEGLFPSERSTASLEGEEEERRLFYVGITRARNELYLSYPLVRTVQAYSGNYFLTPSRFLGEIPNDLLDEWKLRR